MGMGMGMGMEGSVEARKRPAGVWRRGLRRCRDSFVVGRLAHH
jgi:hypothetical protein